MQGRPADVLVDASEGAELVVVGSRGRGGFRGLLLGPSAAASCTGPTARSPSSDRSPHDSDDSATASRHPDKSPPPQPVRQRGRPAWRST